MSIATLLALGLCVLSGVLLVRLAPSAIRSWRIYSGAGRRRQKDAGRRAPAAPPGIKDRVAILAASGYHGIGVTSLDLPVGERFAWIVGRVVRHPRRRAGGIPDDRSLFRVA